MQLYPELRIQTAVEAMKHTIIPALDKNDPLAQQQSQLVVAMLDLALDWLNVQYSYDTNELKRLAQAGDDLVDQVRGSLDGDPAVHELDKATERARDVLARAGAVPQELRDSIRSVNAALGGVIDSAYQAGDAGAKRAAQESVMGLAAELSPFVRSAYRAHGFEGDPDGLPSVQELLDRAGTITHDRRET